MNDATSKSSIYVISDSSGETGERVVRAALLQFPDHKVRVRVFTRVGDREAAENVLRKAVEDQAMLVYTLVSAELRQHFRDWAEEHQLGAIDVIGGLMGQIANFLHAKPLAVPSSAMPLSEDYYRRVEAIEFAVKSDDGREPGNLHRADMVLTGVSRTSKTPLSTYLAGRGFKVANVPLVLGVDPPDELFQIPPYRVVGLSINLDKLLDIRRARLEQLGMPPETNYAMKDHIQEELDYAQSIFKAHPEWLIVVVSGRAIEETAAIVLEAFKDRAEEIGRSFHPRA